MTKKDQQNVNKVVECLNDKQNYFKAFTWGSCRELSGLLPSFIAHAFLHTFLIACTLSVTKVGREVRNGQATSHARIQSMSHTYGGV